MADNRPDREQRQFVHHLHVAAGRLGAGNRSLLHAVLAMLVALTGLLAPLVSDTSTSARAATTARTIARNQTAPTPYIGTAITIWVSRPDLAPRSATRDLGSHRIVSSFSVQDGTHFRVDAQSIGPGLKSNQETVVAGGDHVIWYSSMENRALRMPLTGSNALGLVGLFQGVQIILPGTTLQQDLKALNSKKAGMRARYIGQVQVLARLADVIDVSPAYSVSNSNSKSCNSAKACLKQSHGVGHYRLWIDHQYAVLLRAQGFGIPVDSGFPHHYLYHVTSITVGQGPTAEQLAYTPPGPIVKPPSNTGSGGSSQTFPSSRWQVPAPFISFGGPTGRDGQRYRALGSGEGGEPMVNGPAMEDAVFAPGPVSDNSPYLYVQQLIRADGVPAELRTGQGIRAGSCQMWLGAYPDGLNHLALSRGQIAVLFVSNALSQTDLRRYASKHLCA